MDLSLSAKIITIAGTNGKGTTVALLERLLSGQGFAVGAYTSPHIFHFRERICVDGTLASDGQLVEAFNAVERAREDTDLTYFEFTTLAAAYLFSKANLDFWIMEVGLGGRLDTVNIFEPEVSLVTNIGIDHTDWLGDTLELIAAEKAGVFRKDRPAIFASEKRPQAIDSAISEKQAIGLLAGRDFGIEDDTFWWGSESPNKFPIQSCSSFSSETLSGVLAILACLNQFPDEKEILELSVFSVPGRFQQLKLGKLDLIVDVAHNPDSVRFLAQRLQEYQFLGLTAVIGFMEDKLTPELIEPMLGVVHQWIVVRPALDRAASLESVERTLQDAGVQSENIHCCLEIQNLKQVLGSTGTAVVYGSFYTVGECMSALGVGLE